MLHSRALNLVVLALLCLPSLANADVSSRYRGKIVIQEKPFAAFGTEKQFARIVKKAARNKTLSRDDRGHWSFHFLAFLRRAPKANKVNLVWYRKNRKKGQIDFTEYVVAPNERTLSAKASLRPGQFKPGDIVEARITRVIKGREKTYARCTIKLK